MPCSIGMIAKKAGISRTTLLYYDSIGLFCPSGRSAAGYRLYDDADWDRLLKIRAYRETGIPLDEIKRLLDSDENGKEIVIASALLKRLGELNSEVAACRAQQKIILQILKRQDIVKDIKKADASVWRRLLKESGIQEKTALKWHADFDKYSPKEHREFLKSIGFSEKEIRNIIDWVSYKDVNVLLNDLKD